MVFRYIYITFLYGDMTYLFLCYCSFKQSIQMNVILYYRKHDIHIESSNVYIYIIISKSINAHFY